MGGNASVASEATGIGEDEFAQVVMGVLADRYGDGSVLVPRYSVARGPGWPVFDCAAFLEGAPDPIAVFEFKARGTSATVREFARVLGRSGGLPWEPTRAYVAIADRGSGGPVFYDVTPTRGHAGQGKRGGSGHFASQDPVRVRVEDLPDARSVLALELSSAKRRWRGKATGLRALCWGVVPGIAIVLEALDVAGVVQLAWERLAVIGVSVLAALLPPREADQVRGFRGQLARFRIGEGRGERGRLTRPGPWRQSAISAAT